MVKRLASFVLSGYGIFIFMTFAYAVSNNNHVECVTLKFEQQRDAKIYDIGSVWAGVATSIGSAVTKDGSIIVASYDSDRYIKVSSIDTKENSVCWLKLRARFGGWDAHNSLVVAIANDNSLHIAGNMHATPLVYALSRSGDIQNLRQTGMIGSDEKRSSYPTFIRDREGRLLFLYREGESGDGEWVLNRWDGPRWHRVGVIFSKKYRESHVSAYPTPFVFDQSGYAHVAIVWRGGHDASTNFAVTYAKSYDYLNWVGKDGNQYRGPVSLDNSDIVEETGEGSGLVNDARIILTPAGTPVVLYVRHGSSGMDTLVAATIRDGKWLVRELLSSSHRSNVDGLGASSILPKITVRSQSGWDLYLHLTIPPDRRRLHIDLMTLQANAWSSEPETRLQISAPLPLIEQMDNVTSRVQQVLKYGLDEPTPYHLEWFAQRANGDKPRLCTLRSPIACNPPPSPLLLIAPDQI